MKNYLLLLFLQLFLLLIISPVNGQENAGASKNASYLEVGTNIIVSSVSLNYERHFFSSASEKVTLYGRVGLGGSAVFWGNSGWGGLGAITLLTGPGKHHFETSAGLFSGRQSGYGGGNMFVLPLLDLGYRYQKPGKGFLFRLKMGTLGFGIGLGLSF